jgi:hypothetical protein
LEALASLSSLIAAKARLGKFTCLKFHTADLALVHRRIGELVRGQVHKILASRVGRLSPQQVSVELESVRQAHSVILAKIASHAIPPGIRRALAEYVECLAAWSQGARLDELGERWNSPRGRPAGLDLALLLQKERVGCQTGAYRLTDGSAILWHTEEDVEPEPGGRFDRLRLVSFPILEAGRLIEINAFLYPDLLPGPTFSWRSDHYLQAVDSLPLKPCAQGPALLANVAAWVTLRLGGAFDLPTVIEALGPYWDGYALNYAWVKPGQVRAGTVEFAGDAVLSDVLGDRPGDFLFQVNLCSGKSTRLAAYELTTPQRRAPLEARLKRTEQALREREPGASSMQNFFNLLCSRSGGEYAYANMDVKAYLIGQISPGAMEIWLGPGPALEEDLPNLLRVHA